MPSAVDPNRTRMRSKREQLFGKTGSHSGKWAERFNLGISLEGCYGPDRRLRIAVRPYLMAKRPANSSENLMLHHISFGVSDIERATAFYDAALAPLGYVRIWDDIRPGEPDQAVGYGIPGGGDKLAIKLCPKGQRAPGPGFHLAFAAPNREAVDAFHAAAVGHGGHDNGKPGLRPHYGAHYYAAFVIDPDGHAIEAVYNAPER